MSVPFQITRDYGTDDASLIQFARTTNANLIANLADFTAFDPDFVLPYSITYLADIAAAENFSSDNQLIDVQVQATLDTETKAKQCRDFYQNMKYFIEKTFPNKPGTWAEFGYNDYDDSRRTPEKLIQFMRDLFETATKYQAVLTPAGFPPTKTAEIQILCNALATINTTKDLSKGTRSSAANDRVILLNKVWAKTERICNAGKTLYFNNYGKYQLFLLPWITGGSTASPTNTYTGNIVSGATLNIAIPALAPNTVLTISNTGTVPLRFCGSDIAGSPCPLGLVINPSDSQSVTLQSLATAPTIPTFLNVGHTIAPAGSSNGAYEVVVVS